jgi:hypothetical protein
VKYNNKIMKFYTSKDMKMIKILIGHQLKDIEKLRSNIKIIDVETSIPLTIENGYLFFIDLKDGKDYEMVVDGFLPLYSLLSDESQDKIKKDYESVKLIESTLDKTKFSKYYFDFLELEYNYEKGVIFKNCLFLFIIV